MEFDISKHHLVPKHTKASDAEKNRILQQYHIDLKSLPRILVSDPAIAKLNPKEGELIKIERQSKTAGVALYYRVVVRE